MKQKTATSIFKICNFKASEGFATKLKWQALTSMELNDQELVGIADLPLSFPIIPKRPFYYMTIYLGTDTFVHICIKSQVFKELP